jgi:2-octaprenyl-6-methoxyphenol hydroxylase
MKRIAIVGGGPVGLACASWILEKIPGIHLDLYDRLSESDNAIINGESRGIAVSQGSHLLLKNIGAWPNNSPSIHKIHVSHRGHFGRAIVRREELQQEALGHIVRYAEIHLSIRKALQTISKNAPNFKWHHDQKIDELNKSSLADVVIHAEGGLFKQQEWQEIYRDYEQAAIIGWVKTDRINQNLAWERFTEEGPLALLPNHKGHEYLNLVWCGDPKETQKRLGIFRENSAAFLNDLQKAFGSRAGRFIEVGDLKSYELGLNARKEIVQGHEVWIGNAAQTMHPVAGQGLNLGLRDAHTLAESIAFNNTVHEALNHYQELRKTDRNTTIATTDFLARIFTSNLKPVICARGIALSSLQILAPIKQSLTRQMMFGQR